MVPALPGQAPHPAWMSGGLGTGLVQTTLYQEGATQGAEQLMFIQTSLIPAEKRSPSILPIAHRISAPPFLPPFLPLSLPLKLFHIQYIQLVHHIISPSPPSLPAPLTLTPHNPPSHPHYRPSHPLILTPHKAPTSSSTLQALPDSARHPSPGW